MMIPQNHIYRQIEEDQKKHINPNSKTSFIKIDQIKNGFFAYLSKYKIPISTQQIILLNTKNDDGEDDEDEDEDDSGIQQNNDVFSSIALIANTKYLKNKKDEEIRQQHQQQDFFYDLYSSTKVFEQDYEFKREELLDLFSDIFN